MTTSGLAGSVSFRKMMKDSEDERSLSSAKEGVSEVEFDVNS